MSRCTTYPNLELLEYKIIQQISTFDLFINKFKEKKNENKYIYPELEMTMFRQIWGSTCTGFDEMDDGSPAIGGCAMTYEYTVVARELNTDIYVVCFGNKPCYVVTNPTEQFFIDLQNHNMAGLHESKSKY